MRVGIEPTSMCLAGTSPNQLGYRIKSIIAASYRIFVTIPSMSKQKGIDLTKLGEKLREQADFSGALAALNEAITTLAKESAYPELIIALKDRALTYLHLFNYHHQSRDLELARVDAESMVTIATQSAPASLALAHFTLGKIVERGGNLESAREEYRQALELYQGTTAERGDYHYHYGETVYLTGDKKLGKELMEQGLAEIRSGKGEVDDFLVSVWETRCLLRLALCLKTEDSTASQNYLATAKLHLNHDPRLVILRDLFAELS